MKVSRERLSVIGRMIGIYREERRGNSQNNWTQIKFCDNICSPNTLKNIESGGIARSQELYEKLLEKLDLKLGEFPVIDEAIEKLINELYIAIEYFDNAEIDSLTAKGIKILVSAQNYVYYNELYMIFEDIRNYYLDYTLINDDKVTRYKSISRLYEIKLRDMIILLILAKVKINSINNQLSYEEFIDEFDLRNSQNVCIKLSILHFFYVKRQRFEMMKRIEEVENEFLEKNNLVRLVDVYSFAIVMLSDIDDNKSLEYIDKATKLLNEKVLPKRKVSDLASNIAAFFYNKKDYKNALFYLKEAVDNNCIDLLTNYIIIANCQNHIGEPISIPKLDKKELKKYPDDLRVMYQYFYNAQDTSVPAFVKIKMIMKHILPILNDKILIDVFRFELNNLVEVTNSYKTLFIFEKEIEQKYKS